MLLNYVMARGRLLIGGRGLESVLMIIVIVCGRSNSCIIILDILGRGAALLRLIHDDGRRLDETRIDLLGRVCQGQNGRDNAAALCAIDDILDVL